MATAINYGDVPIDVTAQATLLALRNSGGAAIVSELREEVGVDLDEQIIVRIEEGLVQAGLVKEVGTRRVAQGEPEVTVYGLTRNGQEFVRRHESTLEENAAESMRGGRDVSSLAGSVETLSDDVERLSGSVDRIGSRISQIENALSTAEGDFENVREQLQEHRSAFQTLRSRIDQTNGRIDEVQNELERVERQGDAAREQVIDRVRDALEEHESHVNGELARLRKRVETLEQKSEKKGLF